MRELSGKLDSQTGERDKSPKDRNTNEDVYVGKVQIS